MWRTSSGERTLVGPEAALIRAAIDDVLETFRVDQEIDETSEWGVPLFDGLDQSQKIVVLAYVAEALFREDVPSPPLTGLNEAAVGVLYIAILRAITIEIDCDEDIGPPFRYYWRDLVLAASDLENWPPDDPPPNHDCRDRTEWECLVEGLSDGVLWDDDWQDESFIMDADPETAAFRKNKLGIADDYYLAVAPDPTDEELDRARQALKRLATE